MSTPGNETNVKYNVVISDGAKWRYDLDTTKGLRVSVSFIRATAYSNVTY